jgi:hypothetical protein
MPKVAGTFRVPGAWHTECADTISRLFAFFATAPELEAFIIPNLYFQEARKP